MVFCAAIPDDAIHEDSEKEEKEVAEERISSKSAFLQICPVQDAFGSVAI